MKTIVKTTINRASSPLVAIDLFDEFISLYQGRIIQISGPYLTLTESRSSLPGYIVTGSVIIEDGEEKTTTLGDKLITGVNTTGVKLNG